MHKSRITTHTHSCVTQRVHTYLSRETKRRPPAARRTACREKTRGGLAVASAAGGRRLPEMLVQPRTFKVAWPWVITALVSSRQSLQQGAVSSVSQPGHHTSRAHTPSRFARAAQRSRSLLSNNGTACSQRAPSCSTAREKASMPVHSKCLCKSTRVGTILSTTADDPCGHRARGAAARARASPTARASRGRRCRGGARRCRR